MALGKIIAISNQKGGVGKTTTAINLSACVAHLGKRVLLVDMDPQGNATSGLGLDKRTLAHSAYSVLIGQTPIDQAICSTQYENLSVLPANADLAGAEIELVSVEGRERALVAPFERVRGLFDYVFIDCPPSLGLLTLNALTACDSVLIPIQCEYFALEGVGQLISTLQLVKTRLNPGLAIEGAVLTMLDGRTNLGLQVVQEVKKHFKGKVFATIVPRNIRLGEAPSYGMPILAFDPRCAGSVAYTQLAEELIAQNTGRKAN